MVPCAYDTDARLAPTVIAQAADIPRTISGKISEVAVRETIHGRAVKDTDALPNPEHLVLFANRAERQA